MWEIRRTYKFSEFFIFMSTFRLLWRHNDWEQWNRIEIFKSVVISNFKIQKLLLWSTLKYLLIESWFGFYWHSNVILFEHNGQQQTEIENNRNSKKCPYRRDTHLLFTSIPQVQYVSIRIMLIYVSYSQILIVRWPTSSRMALIENSWIL